AEFFKRNPNDDAPYLDSPEIVVEVRSPSNTIGEIEEKKTLYFEKGAREVWLCDQIGCLRFFSPEKELERSELFMDFPRQIVGRPPRLRR
ncbi:MAG: Uma2 family endonuclease, partial [Deltaproteobacteria bacterium]|nr:Uma2 family endonuclease [Deltaproteobacteria bacterium]